jgi:threonine/homoserine/homoserine lactone efflux protein
VTGEAIGQVLSFAVGVAISPIPIIAVVLMLATPRGRTNGPAFIAGWLVGLSVVGTIVLLASSGADATTDTGPATWTEWLKIGLGALLALVAVKQWRGRPATGTEAELPKWMAMIDGFSPGKSAGTGALLAGVNPKNLLLTAGAAAAIAQTGASTGSQAAALAVFVIIGTLGPGIPVAIYFTMGEKGTVLLARLKTWMGLHNAAIMTVLCAVIAAKLLGDGISGLSA